MRSINFNMLAFLFMVLAASWPGNNLSAQQSDEKYQTLIKGYTEPKVTIQVAFPQPGKIKELAVEQGQRVAKGADLAELESGGMQVSLEIAQARADDDSEIVEAKSALELIDQRLSDLRELADSGGASPDEIRRVETDRKVNQAKLKAAELEQKVQKLDAERLKRELDLKTIRSPIDGYVTRVHRHVGEYVSANEPEVVELVQLHPLKIRFFVPSQAAAKMSLGEEVPLLLPQMDSRRKGKVSQISPVINPVSDTVEVYVELPNEELKLKAGLRCQLKLPRTPKTTNIGKETNQ